MDVFVFRSGKHKGKTLQVVESIDPGYIAWVKLNQPKMLKEQKTIKEPSAPAPRKEPLPDGEGKQSSLQPNLNFLNEKTIQNNGNENQSNF